MGLVALDDLVVLELQCLVFQSILVDLVDHVVLVDLVVLDAIWLLRENKQI